MRQLQELKKPGIRKGQAHEVEICLQAYPLPILPRKKKQEKKKGGTVMEIMSLCAYALSIGTMAWAAAMVVRNRKAILKEIRLMLFEED